MASMLSMPSIWAALSPIRRRFGMRLVIDRDRDYRSSVLLAGTGRSGTTWVSEIINHRNEYRYVFEPFNHQKLRIAQPFGPKRYLRPDDAGEEEEKEGSA